MQKKLIKPLVMVGGAVLFALFQYIQHPDKPQASAQTRTTTTEIRGNQANKDYQQAVEKIRQSADKPDAKFWTGIQGEVVKLLKDDREGSPHQRFLVKISPDITLLVAHNIELGARVPVSEGEPISLYGEYVWNDKGGVIHWTHHDPKGRKGGWIGYRGKRYE
jgi:hypothetical protein